MEVVMSSPVHEPSRTENTGSNDKSQKNNLRMKKKKLLLKSNAENPEIKQQLHQNNPTATVDQKHELSSPEIQHHMVTHTKSVISGETSTSDANTLSERESHAKVSNGEIGSGTPATATTVSNKSKNPSSTDNQSVHETTKTQDIVAVTNNSSTPTPTDVVKVSNKIKKKKKKKNPESVNIQSVHDTTQTQDTVAVTNKSSTTTTTPTPTPTDVVKKKKKKKKNPESVNIQSVQETTQTQEIVPVTNQSSTTTPTDVVKKKKKKKNPESVNIQSVHDTTQTQDTVAVTNKSSTPTPTPTPTDDVKKKKKKKKNPESVNIQSVHDNTQTQNIVSVTNISSSTPPTSDANTLSNGESHAKVSDSEIGSCTPATATTISKKRKNPSSSDIQSVHNTTQTQEIVPVTNQSSTTTPTDVVKVSNEKRKKKKKKNPESVHIQSVQETTQTQDTVAVTNKSSTTTPTLTPTDVVKVSTKKRKKKNPESVNIQSVHETTQTQNIVSVTNKSSSTPPTSDANTLSNGDSNVTNELASRSENKKKQKVSDDDANAKSDEQMERKRKKKKKEREEDVTVHEPGFVKGERIRKPTIGEILKPGYLEELEKAEERRALSKQMSKKNKSVKIADLVNLDSPSQTEVKPRDDKIMEKKLLIFDVNGLLGDIVSPRPKDMVADKYIPQRAIFKRPYLDDFLRFCFERFHVGIWSSRTHKVLDPAVYCLLGNLKKNLLFIWDNSFCTKTKMKTLENKHKPMVFKDLRKIWDKSWWKGPFHESNTLLIDDSPYKALLNPKNTGIFPVSYCYNDMNDNSLGPNGDLRTYLEGLANSDDVKTYVDQHPFGQPAIDQTHPHWNFYSRALNSQRSKLAVHVNQRRVQF